MAYEYKWSNYQNHPVLSSYVYYYRENPEKKEFPPGLRMTLIMLSSPISGACNFDGIRFSLQKFDDSFPFKY